MTEAVAAPATRPTLWRHRNFRRLWIGETVSQVGSQISGIALPLVAIIGLHATTLQVGALTACEWLPFLVLGLPAGAWVDRMRMRRVLIATDLLRACALASVPLAAVFDALALAQLFVVALVVAVGTLFFDVAYQSYLPELIGREDLVAGNARLQASESVASLAGPGIGGALIQAMTAPYAVIADAVSFVWSAGWVAAIDEPDRRPERTTERSLRREIAEGLRFVLGNPLLRSIAAATSICNLFGAMTGALYLVLFVRSLHLAPGAIGLIGSLSAIGGLVGAFGASRVACRLGQGPTIVVAMGASGVLGFALPIVHRDWTLGLLVVAQTLWFACGVIYNITQVSFRQALCPPRLLGRMNATMRFIVWGTLPFGAAIGGVLGSWLGVRETLFVAAVGGMFAVVPLVLSALPRTAVLPSLPHPEE